MRAHRAADGNAADPWGRGMFTKLVNITGLLAGCSKSMRGKGLRATPERPKHARHGGETGPQPPPARRVQVSIPLLTFFTPLAPTWFSPLFPDVSSTFLCVGHLFYMDKDGDKIRKLRPGLWANIHAKRKRGESPARPGDRGYPDQKQWRKLSGK